MGVPLVIIQFDGIFLCVYLSIHVYIYTHIKLVVSVCAPNKSQLEGLLRC